MSSQRLFSLQTACATVASLRAPLIAVAVASLLSACGGSTVSAPPSASSTGSGSGAGTTTTTTTTGAHGTNGLATAVAQTTSDLGNTIAAQSIPGVSSKVTEGLGDAVSNTGTTLNALADAVSNGLGQTGSTANPVGTTVAGLGSVVSSTSGVVQGVSNAVDGLGSGQFSALAPLTTPLASTLATTATTLNAGGATLGNVLDSSTVQQVTQPLSTAITPLVTSAGLITQTVGTRSGLGVPLGGVLAQVGGALDTAGAKVGSATGNALGNDAGMLVSSLGNTVTNAGGLVNPNGPNGAYPVAGLLTSLVGSTHVAVANGTSSSVNPLGALQGSLAGLGLGNDPLGSLTTLLGGSPLATLSSTASGTPLASLTSTPGGSGGGTTSNPLATLTGTLSGLNNGTSSGNASSSALAPVTSLVGQLSATVTTVTGSLGTLSGSSSSSAASASSSSGNAASGVTTLLGSLLPVSHK